MRWLVGHPGPQFSVHDLYEGWVEALRQLGEDVYPFNLGDRLSFYDAAHVEAAGITDEHGNKAMRKAMTRETAIETAADGIFRTLYKCWPHVVLLVSGFFTPPWMLDLIRDRGHKVVLLHTESPYQDDEQLIRAKSADINLVNDPANIGAYKALGPAAYMPHAYRPLIHHPAPPGSQPEYDLAFVGTGFPSRREFFERMDLAGLNVRLAGLWPDIPPESPLRAWTPAEGDDCMDNADAARIYQRTRCGINFYRREAEENHAGEGWAMGPREVELAACGTFFVRDPRGEGDDVLSMLPTFTSPEQAGDLIRWYVAHPDDRERRALAAREAIAERTFINNAKALMRMIEKE